MDTSTGELAPDQSWPRCPRAAEFFISLFRAFAAHNPAIARMADRFLDCAGVPLINLIDHWVVPRTYSLDAELTTMGLVPKLTADGDPVWEHPQARLPRLRIDDAAVSVRMAIAVEDLKAFADCNDLPVLGQLGDPGSGYEEIRYPQHHGELAVIVRRGNRGFRPGSLSAADERTIARVQTALMARSRSGEGFHAAEETAGLIASLVDEIESDRLVDEFFDAERHFYMRRNAAARWQYARQLRAGIGWANHDHHTYRSSRSGFRALIGVWRKLGFELRERFYAGKEAGWGAQILEHPVSRVVLFCDVDVAPEELDIDYSARDLEPLRTAGTIGLWCGLNGESIGAAGLHHLEAEYDFARVRDQFVAAGYGVMPPFTDLPMLKQAFTEPETWIADPIRCGSLLDLGLITADQHDGFLERGVPGSHLEILQRWDGFKGFNKTGIDAIIRRTDARTSQQTSVG